MCLVPKPTATLEQLQKLVKKEPKFTLFELLMLIDFPPSDLVGLKKLTENYTRTSEKTITGALAGACKFHGSMQEPLYSEALQAQAYLILMRDVLPRVAVVKPSSEEEPFITRLLSAARSEFSSLDEKSISNPSGRITMWNRLIKEAIARMCERFIHEEQAKLMAESTMEQVKEFSKSIKFLEPYLKNVIEQNELYLELSKHVEALEEKVSVGTN